MMVLPLLLVEAAPLDDDVIKVLVVPFPFPELELDFCMLQRLVPLERKLPKEMDPFALMNGVVRCC